MWLAQPTSTPQAPKPNVLPFVKAVTFRPNFPFLLPILFLTLWNKLWNNSYFYDNLHWKSGQTLKFIVAVSHNTCVNTCEVIMNANNTLYSLLGQIPASIEQRPHYDWPVFFGLWPSSIACFFNKKQYMFVLKSKAHLRTNFPPFLWEEDPGKRHL